MLLTSVFPIMTSMGSVSMPFASVSGSDENRSSKSKAKRAPRRASGKAEHSGCFEERREEVVLQLESDLVEVLELYEWRTHFATPTLYPTDKHTNGTERKADHPCSAIANR